jgi:hypothetical protein
MIEPEEQEVSEKSPDGRDKLESVFNKLGAILKEEGINDEVVLILNVPASDGTKTPLAVWNCHPYDAARMTAFATKTFKSQILKELDTLD